MSLCEQCLYRRAVISGSGSRFLLCRRGLTDGRFAKYPPQPVLDCDGFELGEENDSADDLAPP